MTDASKIRQTREMIKRYRNYRYLYLWISFRLSSWENFQVIANIKLDEILVEVAETQQELAQDLKHLRTDRVEEAEEKGEGSSHLPPKQTTGPAPNSVEIHDHSFSNGSGNMHNSNVGNIVNNNVSNVGNDNSSITATGIAICGRHWFWYTHDLFFLFLFLRPW